MYPHKNWTGFYWGYSQNLYTFSWSRSFTWMTMFRSWLILGWVRNQLLTARSNVTKMTTSLDLLSVRSIFEVLLTLSSTINCMLPCCSYLANASEPFLRVFPQTTEIPMKLYYWLTIPVRKWSQLSEFWHRDKQKNHFGPDKHCKISNTRS